MSTTGVDIRQTTGQLILRVLLQDSSGALVTSGTTTLKLYELQDDGTLFSYDFDDNTFKSGALTTETVNMTHRQGNNNTTDTGLWTYELETITDFVAGNIYFAMANNSGAFPTDQMREFQFGGAEGDMSVTSGNLHSTAQAMANDVITAAAIATDAIDADALKADAVTEITDDIMAEVIDVLTLKNTLKRVLAFAAGKMTDDGSDVVYTEQDMATTEMTHNYAGQDRTVS